MQRLFPFKIYSWQTKSFLLANAAIIFCLLLWFLPFTHPYCAAIDRQFFLSLNHTLAWSSWWQKLCGWLNHPAESWLNLVVMLGINFLAIFSLEKTLRKPTLLFIIYCWGFFQLGLLLSHAIFGNLLAIERASPSLVLQPIIKLSNLALHPVKDYSENSFPAGHTFVLIYWAGFTNAYAPKFKWLTTIIAILLIFPRLISGAHWLSDVIFTMTISYAWLVLAINTPLYPKFLRR